MQNTLIKMTIPNSATPRKLFGSLSLCPMSSHSYIEGWEKVGVRTPVVWGPHHWHNGLMSKLVETTRLMEGERLDIAQKYQWGIHERHSKRMYGILCGFPHSCPKTNAFNGFTTTNGNRPYSHLMRPIPRKTKPCLST